MMEGYAQMTPFKEAKRDSLDDFEQRYLCHMLRKTAGNITRAARRADLDRKHFRKLMRKHQISAYDFME
jgi:DNA-binding NtrC family response regulator